MSGFVVAFSVLLAFTALLAWANERFTRIPTTVGVTLAGALASLLILGADHFGPVRGIKDFARDLLTQLDFTDFLLNGILSFILFAGALGLNARQVLRQRRSVLTLAVVSTILSVGLFGLAAYGVFRLVGLDIPVLWCLLFGALISPTDPVAVLDLLKRIDVPERIRTIIAGEALFNDGVGIVLFLVLGGLVGLGGAHAGDPSAATAGLLFVQEALGGAAFGALLGYLGYTLCRTIEGHGVEVLITLALVVSGYVACVQLGISGPIAMVVAGLVLSWGKEEAFHDETRTLVEGFWETLDEVLNIVLFAFIGVDVLLTETAPAAIVAALILIAVALAARFVSVAIPMPLVRTRDGYAAWTVRLLTWGGLRGGIAISLALSLPQNDYRGPILTATYAIVLFSIAVQGLTIAPLVTRAVAADRALHGATARPVTPETPATG